MKIEMDVEELRLKLRKIKWLAKAGDFVVRLDETIKDKLKCKRIN